MSMPFGLVDRAAKGFAWVLVNLCLTFDVPTSAAKADCGPADHSRAQGLKTLSGPGGTSFIVRQ